MQSTSHENCPNTFCPAKTICITDPRSWKTCGLRREYISTVIFNQTRNQNHHDKYYDNFKPSISELV